MSVKGKSKEEIYGIASEFLTDLLQTEQYFSIKTEEAKENSKYYLELCNKLIESLNPQQEKLFRVICDVQGSIEATVEEAAMLYGMQVKESFDELTRDPLGALNYHQAQGKSTREVYFI